MPEECIPTEIRNEPDNEKRYKAAMEEVLLLLAGHPLSEVDKCLAKGQKLLMWGLNPAFMQAAEESHAPI